ncbi:ABC transporter ATP-binding protein [Leeia oryzae]|uniref:ABC transporter ATP-binding protein n=1 Tax=Leeia oryzae TaxID=356662 RepID=UPI00037DF71A|nr:sn-glycerol-3-phosphate ABC transporter ATP-binding protein UgpC [Leeia oryzae]
MSSLHIQQVRKSYGSTDILKGIDIGIDDGEFLVLVGPSGCGKSTLLSMIAGLDTVTSGDILIGNQRVNDLHPSKRDIAMVFQSYALYPNMSVAENIAFGMEMRKVPKAEREKAIQDVAKLLQMQHLLDRRPSQLSGGQRQRVAMGRALVRHPQIFLFDEPLSNLDAKLRVDMRTEIKKLHQRLKATIVYVTHDQIEAMTLATKIAVMRNGELQQLGSPSEVYNKPANTFVASFIGSPSMNLIPGRLVPHGDGLALEIEHNTTEGLQIPLPPQPDSVTAYVGKEIIAGLRPEAIGNGNLQKHELTRQVQADLVVTEPTGPDTLAILKLGGFEVTARLEADATYPAGHRGLFTVDLTKLVMFDSQTEQRIA